MNVAFKNAIYDSLSLVNHGEVHDKSSTPRHATPRHATPRHATPRHADIGIRTLLSLAFAAAGLAKLVGAEMMIATFEAIDSVQWFRHLTGLIEVGSAVLLWVPGMKALAAVTLWRHRAQAGLA